MIDMKALHTWSQGDPSSKIEVNKRWLCAVADMLERLSIFRDTPYDTTVIRMLSTSGENQKVQVTRAWLAHVHGEMQQLQMREKDRQSRPSHHDRHFPGNGVWESETVSVQVNGQPMSDHRVRAAQGDLDNMFHYMDRAFRNLFG